mgnify:FL=1
MSDEQATVCDSDTACWWHESSCYTLEQLQNGRHDEVTHVVIKEHLPENLADLAPNITHLCIWNCGNVSSSQLSR